jgi:hypothetical protein
MDSGVLRELGPDVFQFGFLLVARERGAASPPGGDALLQPGVVEVAAAPDDLVQRPFLRGRGAQLLLIGFAQRLSVHAPPFCTACDETAWFVGAGAKAQKRLTARGEPRRLAAG